MENSKLKVLSIEFVKTKSEKVRARADVHFDGFILKGFKILKEAKTNKEFVTPPSYKAGIFWRPLFRTDTPQDWQEIQRKILQEFQQYQINESLNETILKEEN